MSIFSLILALRKFEVIPPIFQDQRGFLYKQGYIQNVLRPFLSQIFICVIFVFVSVKLLKNLGKLQFSLN